MAQEYWIYKGSSCHFDNLELNDEADGMVKSKPCGFYDGVSLSDTIEGGIHVIDYSEYERIKAENARFRDALEDIVHCIYSNEATLNYCEKKAREALKGE